MNRLQPDALQAALRGALRYLGARLPPETGCISGLVQPMCPHPDTELLLLVAPHQAQLRPRFRLDGMLLSADELPLALLEERLQREARELFGCISDHIDETEDALAEAWSATLDPRATADGWRWTASHCPVCHASVWQKREEGDQRWWCDCDADA